MVVGINGINDLVGLRTCPCFNRMIERQVSREVVDGGSAHVWLDFTSKMKQEKCIEITANWIFTDKLFVFVVRPTDRLNAPEEAARCLPGMKTVYSDYLGITRIKSDWDFDTLWIILDYVWSLFIKWPLLTPSCVVSLQAFVDYKLGSMSYLVSLPIKVRL